jgi:hypothetical protein
MASRSENIQSEVRGCKNYPRPDFPWTPVSPAGFLPTKDLQSAVDAQWFWDIESLWVARV